MARGHCLPITVLCITHRIFFTSCPVKQRHRVLRATAAYITFIWVGVHVGVLVGRQGLDARADAPRVDQSHCAPQGRHVHCGVVLRGGHHAPPWHTTSTQLRVLYVARLVVRTMCLLSLGACWLVFVSTELRSLSIFLHISFTRSSLQCRVVHVRCRA